MSWALVLTWSVLSSQVKDDEKRDVGNIYGKRSYDVLKWLLGKSSTRDDLLFWNEKIPWFILEEMT